MKMRFELLCVVFLWVVFASCDSNRVYEVYKPIPKSGWNKDSLAVFSVPVTDTLQNYNLYIDVRNDITYSYSNLWLFIEIDQPGGKALKDTFEISLAEPSGKWLGEGWGGKKTRQVIYRRDIYFPSSGIYRIKLQQGMREPNLKGISDIGIRLEGAGS